MQPSEPSQSRYLRPLPALPMPESLPERVGQLVGSGFRGLTAAEAAPTIECIRRGTLGGVAIFSVDEETAEPKNVRSAPQLRRLIAALQANRRIPTLVAVDAEGAGFYQQLRPEHGFPATQSAQDLGERNDPVATHEVAAAMAAWLADVGITVNFAPVVDLLHPGNVQIGTRRRAFSPDPDVVVAHAREFIRAHHEHGVLCAVKHFPGMGSATGDTYLDAVDLTATWSERDLVPFRALIAEGLVDVVATQHLFQRGLDPELSVPMSPRIATDLLRGKLGFDGVLATTTFEQESIWRHYGLERAVVLAVKAGVDYILLSNPSFEIGYDEGRPQEVVGYLVAAVERGEIAESRIDDACRRVLRLKERQLRLRAEAAGRIKG